MEDRNGRTMSVGEILDTGQTIAGGNRWPYVEGILRERELALQREHAESADNCGVREIGRKEMRQDN